MQTGKARRIGLLITVYAAAWGVGVIVAPVWAQEEAAGAVSPMVAAQPEGGQPAAADAGASTAQQVEPQVLDTIPVPVAPEPLPAQEPEVADRPQIAEVVVTATKREESARKIAGTVNAISGEDLEKSGARELLDYLRNVPGVAMQEGTINSNRTLSIRGITPGLGANTTVGVLINDVGLSDPYSSFMVPDLDPFDLHDMEVLKGPQGTLFGASALNGAIRYVLAKPELGVLRGKAFGSWTAINEGGSEPAGGAAINIPVGDTLALRAVGVRQLVPGLYDDINVNKNVKDADSGAKSMYRVLGLWRPIDDLTVNAFYLHQKNRRDDLGIANNIDGDLVRTDTPGDSSLSQEFSVANLDIRYDFDWATLVSETSRSTKAQNNDYDGSPLLEALAVRGIQSLRIASQSDSTAIAQELRLVSRPGDSNWVWLVGGYYYRYRAETLFDTYLANTGRLASLLHALTDNRLLRGLQQLLAPNDLGIPVLASQYDPLRAEEKSLFGEVTRKFFDGRAALTFGGRWYKENLNADVTALGLTSPITVLQGGTGHRELDSDGFSPKFSGTLQVTDNILWYAAASRGFQFGGLNNPAALPWDNIFPLTYKPSTLWSYESGLRTDWFHKTLQLDATVFLIDWKDMQMQQKTSDGLADYTTNIGKARSRGVEAAFRWLTPLRGVMLSNSSSYIYAEVAQPFTTNDGQDVPAGWQLPVSPRVQSTTTLSYNAAFWGMEFGSGISYAYQGPAWSNLRHEKVIYDYSQTDLNFSLGMPDFTGQPELALNVTNVFDERAIVGTNINRITILGPQTQFGSYIRPRTFILRLTMQF
ncbi:MAG: TonB-dependent receptor [Solimonas sp.]